MVDAGDHQVGEADIGLVAERHEPRDAQPVPLQQIVDIDDEVAALREHGDLSCGEGLAGKQKVGRGVDESQTVGADEDGSGVADSAYGLGLECRACLVGLGEAGRDSDDRLGTGRQRVVHCIEKAADRNADGHELDRLARVDE